MLGCEVHRMLEAAVGARVLVGAGTESLVFVNCISCHGALKPNRAAVYSFVMVCLGRSIV